MASCLLSLMIGIILLAVPVAYEYASELYIKHFVQQIKNL